MKKHTKFMVVAGLCMSMAIPVSAGNIYVGAGSRTGHVTVQSYSSRYNNFWNSVIDKSIASWNNSDAGISIKVSPNSKNTIDAKKYDDQWLGATVPLEFDSEGNLKRYQIKLNAKTIKENARNHSNYARSTSVHEFGHILWLDDNPPTNRATIMSYKRDRNTMTEPQVYDIKNVKAKYNK